MSNDRNNQGKNIPGQNQKRDQNQGQNPLKRDQNQGQNPLKRDQNQGINQNQQKGGQGGFNPNKKPDQR
jgi:hypothetical protein